MANVRTEPDRGTDRGEWRASGNLPPLSREDILGIAVAVVGTLILIGLAIASANGQPLSHSADGESSYVHGAEAIGRLLIALFAILINLAHVVGIFLFESVDYHGPFQKMFAKLSLYGTPLAVVVSLLFGLL